MDNLFKFKHVDGSSKSGTGYPQFYFNVFFFSFFWRERHWAMSNQHNWSLQLAILCYKSNSIVSMKECIIIWSSVSHIKPWWTFFPWILTYAAINHFKTTFFNTWGFATKLYQTWIIYSSSNMLMVQVRVVPGIPNSIWMLSSEESSIEQYQNIIEVFN